MENQMYLTPSQVEELRKLEVEFEDTDCVWLMYADGTYERSVIGKMNLATIRVESAPSLQEVMEKLPKHVMYPANGTLNMPLSLSWCDVTERWYIGYEHAGIDHGHLDGHDTNPLLAAYELLLWVAKTYPDSLIKDE